MKLKLRFSGRGGQGIKFLGTALVRVAMLGKYFATLSVDYTPSVRGGPIFCDVVLSSNPISYPFCDKDADVFIAIDQKGFDRASECIWENTISFVDTNTVENPEEVIKVGTLYRIPISRRADENNVPMLILEVFN
jgi:2-oxoglutarate ferredoxin oxidoreductase subunit gamma